MIVYLAVENTTEKADTGNKKEAFWNHPEVKSLFWMLVLIFFIRGFIAEPFKIPSGSMIPTLLVGDHLFVAKSSYDLGVPFTDKKIVRIADPKRGDVVVFEYPNNEQDPNKEGLYYIKRIIGLPGDEISVKGGVPYFTGNAVPQSPVNDVVKSDARLPDFDLNPNHRLLLERLPTQDHDHWIQRYPYRTADLPEVIQELKAQTGRDCIEVGSSIKKFMGGIFLNEICPFHVPQGYYFVMGDNRDDSADGREWGFVDRSLLKGRALFIWFSWKDFSPPFLRWSRLGLGIK